MYNTIQQSKLHNLNYPWSRSLTRWFWPAVVSWEIKVLGNSKALVSGLGAEGSGSAFPSLALPPAAPAQRDLPRYLYVHVRI